jgi:hypothetical protein
MEILPGFLLNSATGDQGKEVADHASRRQRSAKESPDAPDEYVFVEFNAWLYQGYDVARAALMESITAELARLAEKRQTCVDKTREFLGRIDWFRAASLTAGSAVALALGYRGDRTRRGRRHIGTACPTSPFIDATDPCGHPVRVCTIRRVHQRSLSLFGIAVRNG